jgi:hypothetical protein
MLLLYSQSTLSISSLNLSEVKYYFKGKYQSVWTINFSISISFVYNYNIY